jgi:hypothetical protein
VPEADVALLRSLYTNSWYYVANDFGRSARCPLNRGVKQGDVLSPLLFGVVINILLQYLKDSDRGYVMEGTDTGNGVGAYCDDMFLATGGADAVPQMQVLVDRLERFCAWSGLSVNILKSEISAFDHGTGRRMATDAVLYKGSPFAALDPSLPFTYLGARVTLTGSWQHEKTYIMEETRQRLQALSECPLPRHSAKAKYVATGIAPVFQYSAGLVPWSDAELERLSTLWAAGAKAALGFSRSLDSAAVRLTEKMAGRQ